MTQEKEEIMKEESKELDYKNKIEALLFSAGKKLEVDFLKEVIGAKDKRPVKKALEELKKYYEQKESSLMIIEEGDGWKITVREKYLPIVRKIVSETELSTTVMETLAVIAWKSPVLQSEVIHIRTNKAYEHVGGLLEAGFITKEKQGRSFMLKVTGKFYEYFDVDGAEGIREVFSKIKEKPEQKKVDEFEKQEVKQAEDDMETEKLGDLEVVDEESDKEKLGDLEVVETDDEDSDESKETEEELEDTAKEIVEDELTDEDKKTLEDVEEK